MFVKDKLTVKQIASLRQTSERNVRKIRQQLREKAFLDLNDNAVPTRGGPPEPARDDLRFRVHGQIWTVQLITKGEKYTRIRKKASVLRIGDESVSLSPNSITIHANSHFYGRDPEDAFAKSMDHWNAYFQRLEREFAVLLVKPRRANIRLARCHVAEVGNELAKDSVLSGDKVRIYSTDDNKAWFEIDNSWNLREAETIHPERSVRDMQDTVMPFFNDLRDEPHLLPSHATSMIFATQDQLRELSEHVNRMSAHLEQLAKIQPAPSATEEGTPSYIG